MDFSKQIREVLETRKWTQAKLATALGIHPASIGNYLYGGREPEPFTCLLLAGVAATTVARNEFLRAAGIDEARRLLIEKAVTVDPAPVEVMDGTRNEHRTQTARKRAG